MRDRRQPRNQDGHCHLRPHRAQSAKQVIIQKLKDAEKDAVYTGFIDRRGKSSTASCSASTGTSLSTLARPRACCRSASRSPGATAGGPHPGLDPGGAAGVPRAAGGAVADAPQLPDHALSHGSAGNQRGIVSIMGASREPGVRPRLPWPRTIPTSIRSAPAWA
jgi:transcription elongation factor